MKWRTLVKEVNEPKVGDTRVVRRFLFFPKSFPWGISKELKDTRWLEFAEIKQEYQSETVTSEFCLGEKCKWVNVGWVNLI